MLPLSGGASRDLGGATCSADFGPDGASLCAVRQVPGREPYSLEWPLGETFLKSDQALRCPRVWGRHLAVFWESGQSGSNGSIVLADKDELPRTLASCQGFTSLAWAPGGNEIWYTTFDGSESLIQAVSLKGASRVLGRHPDRLELMDVGPGGRCLALVGSVLRQVFGRPPGGARDLDLTWFDAQTPADLARDGRHVLLTRSGVGPANVYLRPMDGGPGVPFGTGDAVLSPDGRTVLTVETWQGRPSLRLTPTGEGAPRHVPLNAPVTSLDTLYLRPGSQRVYFHHPGDGGLGYVDLTTGEQKADAFPDTGVLDRQPIFSPDGRKVLLQDTRQEPSPDALPLEVFEAGGAGPRRVRGNRSTEAVAGWDARNESVYLYDRNTLPAAVTLWNLNTGARKPFLKITPPDSAGAWGIESLKLTPAGDAYAYAVVRELSELYLIEGLY